MRSSQTDSFNYRDISPSQHTEIDPNMHEDIDQKLVQKPLVDTHSKQFAVNFTPEPLSVLEPRSDPLPLTTRSEATPSIQGLCELM